MLRRTIDYAGQGEREESPRRELSLKIVWKTACKHGRVGGEGGGIKQGGKPIKLLRGNGEKENFRRWRRFYLQGVAVKLFSCSPTTGCESIMAERDQVCFGVEWTFCDMV